jgi:myosin-3
LSVKQVNPVLEAFGNAKTKFNNNSSRFGKYTSIDFNAQGAVKGASIIEYLLEKSRVVFQGDGEQNFHIFYLFFQGLGKDPSYAGGDVDHHRFVDGNSDAIAHCKKGLSEAKGKQGFAVEYQELLDAYKTVGFTQEQIEDIWHIISGICHLGDLEFEGAQGGVDSAKMVSDAEILEDCCAQLGIANSHVLELGVTQKSMIIMKEEVIKDLQVAEAEDVRDATAKAIYTAVFSWIVKNCNEQLALSDGIVNKDDTKMGILDIFGFECFDSNSLEQLCINLCNEQLQWYFNEFIFAMELEEYAKEGIKGSDIKYEDNQALLDLLMHNRPNLYGCLDEQCTVPKANDSTMCIAFHGIGKSLPKSYIAPKGNADEFTIIHYAGAVKYEGHGFLDKNKDTLAADVVACLRLSENELLKGLFADGSGGGGGKRGGKRGNRDAADAKKKMRASIKHARTDMAKKVKKTTGSIFKDSLLALKTNLLASQPHFIRTIKPNHAKQPNIFDSELIMRQLKYTGMLETTRIRREGYSARPTFADFIKRYKVLGFPCAASVSETAESCRQIMVKAGVEGYQVGKTKMFLRYFHADDMATKLHPYTEAATIMSKYCRGFTGRAKYGALVAEKRKQDKAVTDFINSLERQGEGVCDVVVALEEEDVKAHPRKFGAAPAPKPVKSTKKKGMSRAASVKWFQEEEESKGSGKTDDGGFADWFHGIISRSDAEVLLKGSRDGTFLIRVAESRFGYSLSMWWKGAPKHFMIDQNAQERYIVVGNDRTFPSLNEVVAFHMKHAVTDDGDVLTGAAQVDGPRNDLAELKG